MAAEDDKGGAKPQGQGTGGAAPIAPVAPPRAAPGWVVPPQMMRIIPVPAAPPTGTPPVQPTAQPMGPAAAAVAAVTTGAVAPPPAPPEDEEPEVQTPETPPPEAEPEPGEQAPLAADEHFQEPMLHAGPGHDGPEHDGPAHDQGPSQDAAAQGAWPAEHGEEPHPAEAADAGHEAENRDLYEHEPEVSQAHPSAPHHEEAPARAPAAAKGKPGKLSPPLAARSTDRVVGAAHRPPHVGGWILLMVVLLLVAGGLWLWRQGRLDPLIARIESHLPGGTASTAPPAPESPSAPSTASLPEAPPAAPAEATGVPMLQEIKQLLAKLDLAPGPMDGTLDPETEAAIRSYQEMAGMPVDGQPSQELLDDLRAVVADQQTNGG
jgi:hypothetical protein